MLFRSLLWDVRGRDVNASLRVEVSVNVERIRPELAAALAALLVGAWFGWFIASRSAHAMAVQNTCGYYDSRTGEFKWGTQ